MTNIDKSKSIQQFDPEFASSVYRFFKPMLDNWKNENEEDENLHFFYQEAEKVLVALASPKRAEKMKPADFSFALGYVNGVTTTSDQNIPYNRTGDQETDKKQAQLYADSTKLFLKSCAKIYPDVKCNFNEWDKVMKLLSSLKYNPQFLYTIKGEYNDDIKLLNSNPQKFAARLSQLLYSAGQSLQSTAWYAFNSNLKGHTSNEELAEIHEEVAMCIEAIYKLHLMREELKNKPIDTIRKDTGSGAKSTSGLMTDEELRAAREHLAKMNISGTSTKGLDAASLAGKKFKLDENGPFAALYEKQKSVEDIRRVVTPEMKRLMLEYLLQEIDKSIQQAQKVLEPGAILNRKTLTQFCGLSVQMKYAGVYQKIAVAAAGKFISADEMALMPIAEYLKNYLDYDLKSDKVRFELLQKYTNALL